MDRNDVCLGIILSGGGAIMFAFMFMSEILLLFGLLIALVGLGWMGDNK